MAEESFNNKHIILELYISIINISNKPCQCRSTDYWADDTGDLYDSYTSKNDP